MDERTRSEPWLRVVDNPRRKASAAFNLGVNEAKGEVLCLFSAHGVPGQRPGTFLLFLHLHSHRQLDRLTVGGFEFHVAGGDLGDFITGDVAGGFEDLLIF